MKEFITLMAFLMAMVALSIDAMLPALPQMAADLGVARHNDIQYIIAFIFIGMTIGQLIYGPLADAIGRKPALYTGLVLFMAGSAVCVVSNTLPMMLVGRLIQGFGVAAPRIIVMAIVRDRFEGRDMAYVMSMVMGVFIMVPAIAPALGQVILHLFGWHAIYIFYIAAALVAVAWAALRLDETLTLEHRRPFEIHVIAAGFVEAARNRYTLGYTLCGGLAFGALLGYLNSSQQIFFEIYQSGDLFSLYFGMLALAIGAAFFSNSALVQKHGMRHITSISMQVLLMASVAFFIHVLFAPPSLLIFMLFMATAFFCLGLMFGNMAAMALAPMGHMAGLASTFNGVISSLISLTLGIVIGQHFDGTLMPLAIGFVCLSSVSWMVMRWTERVPQTA